MFCPEPGREKWDENKTKKILSLPDDGLLMEQTLGWLSK